MTKQFLYLPSGGAIPGIGGTYAPGIYQIDFVARTIAFYINAPVALGENLVADRVSFTYLVAANNSTTLARNSADFVCSGTNDQSVIQNAFNGLPASGGVVMFAEGLYSLSADIVVPSNAMAIGAGRATILQIAANSSANGLKLSGVSHCLVANLTIDGNKTNVNQLGIQYTQLNGVYMAAGTDDVTIRDCYIHDCYVSGIMADGGCTNLMIANNRLVNNFDNQIYIRAKDTTPYTTCSNGTIVGNICSGGSYSGIQVLGSSYYSITGNTCYNNGPTAGQGDGIGSEGASYITITGNTCYNNGCQGIQSRFTAEVGTNQISSHIVIADNVVYNQTGTGGDYGGIGVNDSDDVLVSGNLIYGNYFGLNINGGFGLGVTHCQVMGNSIRNNSNIGLRVSPGNASDFLLQDNYVADNGGDNVYITVRTMIQGGVYARAASNKEGLHFSTGANNSVIQNAYIFDNLDNGILIDSPVSGIEIRNCYFNGGITQNQTRALQEQAGAGPTRMVGCRILNQNNNLYTFNHAASRYFDEQTLATTIVTTNYTCVANDEIILCNQSGAITVTLPAATGGVIGKVITIKDKAGNANTNTITVSGAQTIDGTASKTITTAYGVLRLISDGNNWFSL